MLMLWYQCRPASASQNSRSAAAAAGGASLLAYTPAVPSIATMVLNLPRAASSTSSRLSSYTAEDLGRILSLTVTCPSRAYDCTLHAAHAASICAESVRRYVHLSAQAAAAAHFGVVKRHAAQQRLKRRNCSVYPSWQRGGILSLLLPPSRHTACKQRYMRC